MGDNDCSKNGEPMCGQHERTGSPGISYNFCKARKYGKYALPGHRSSGRYRPRAKVTEAISRRGRRTSSRVRTTGRGRGY